jgi:hypothetical protein
VARRKRRRPKIVDAPASRQSTVRQRTRDSAIAQWPPAAQSLYRNASAESPGAQVRRFADTMARLRASRRRFGGIVPYLVHRFQHGLCFALAPRLVVQFREIA